MREATGLISKARNFFWSRPILKDTLTTSAFTFIGRSVGFFIPLFIAAWYGVGGETDAFFFSYGIIFFLTIIINGGTTSVIVPFVAEARVQRKEQSKFIGSLLVATGLAVTLLCLIFAFGGYPLYGLFTRFTVPQVQLAYLLTLEIFPVSLFVIWGSLLAGVLSAYHSFARPQLSLAGRSLITLLFIFLLKGYMGIHAIPVGYILGEGARLLYLYFLLVKALGVNIKLALPDAETGRFVKTSSLMMLGSTFMSFNFVLDKVMASWLGVSAVSLLEYGNKLFFLPATFLGEGLFLVLVSHWSNRFYAGNFANLRPDLFRALKLIFLFAAPLSVVLFLFRYELTQLVYGRGAFPRDRLAELSQITGMFLIGLTPRLLNGLLFKAIIILKDTLQMVKLAILCTILNFGFNLLFMYFLGVKGIALSTSVVEFIQTGILWILFNQSLNKFLETS